MQSNVLPITAKGRFVDLWKKVSTDLGCRINEKRFNKIVFFKITLKRNNLGLRQVFT